jgi:hypothetical protein
MPQPVSRRDRPDPAVAALRDLLLAKNADFPR